MSMTTANNPQSPEASRRSAPRLPQGELRGAQRRHLRGLAHHLEPIVHVGKVGVTEAVEEAVAMALEQHELIKVKVLEGAPLPRKEVASSMAAAVGAHVVGQLGRIVILYRRHPEEPRIELPR